MANQIKMSPDQMRSRASQYKAEAGKVQNVISTMDKLLNQLQGEWEGEASKSYAERYSELKPSFTKAQQLIEEIANSLNRAAQTLESTDADLASAFKG